MNYLIDKYEFVIRDNDVDSKGLFKPLELLDIFQTLASRNAHNNAIGYESLKDKGLAWILVKMRYKILKIVSRYDIVLGETWPLEPTRVEYDRAYDILDSKGEVVAEALSKWCVFDTNTRRVSREQVVYPGMFVNKNVSVSFDRATFKENVLDEDVISSFEHVLDYEVKNSDIDLNNHMNNTKYAKLIYDSVSMDEDILDLEIHYINQAMLHDKLSLYKKVKDNNIYLFGLCKDRKEVIFKAIIYR